MLGRGLLKDFPNPERIGCPGAEVLKKIASHQMPLSEAEKWLDHLGSCSPCYADFKRLQEAHDWRRRRMLLATAAGILLVVSVGGWAWFHKHNGNLVAETAVLDLRDRSSARGTEMNPDQTSLELSRRASNLTILLPLGSTEGYYQMRVVTLSREEVTKTSGTASLRGGITSLQVALRLDSLTQGKYLLQIRRPESEWSSYPIVLK